MRGDQRLRMRRAGDEPAHLSPRATNQRTCRRAAVAVPLPVGAAGGRCQQCQQCQQQRAAGPTIPHCCPVVFTTAALAQLAWTSPA